MTTTLDLDEDILKELRLAVRTQGRTESEIVEAALRAFLSQRIGQALAPLPAFQSGGMLVDISDRDALEDAMTSSERGGPEIP